VSTKEVSIWSSVHGTRGDLGVFKSAAELRGLGMTDTIAPCQDGRAVLALAEEQAFRSVGHLVIAAHGGTTWIIDDEYGLTTGRARRAGQVTVKEFVDVWAPYLTETPLISLAACMCSRSPTWFLRRKWGRDIGSDWGARAYLPGGQASISARIRDGLVWHGLFPRVRGHRAAGHATALALLSEHRFPAGDECAPLFQITLPGIEPSLLVRRWWVRHVTGMTAARWLMGDDSVIDEIRSAWSRR
jgi:hypothetical protein